jgi:hypothetical protein
MMNMVALKLLSISCESSSVAVSNWRCRATGSVALHDGAGLVNHTKGRDGTDKAILRIIWLIISSRVGLRLRATMTKLGVRQCAPEPKGDLKVDEALHAVKVGCHGRELAGRPHCIVISESQ